MSTAPWSVNPDSIRLFLACENPLTAPPAKAGIRFAATGATLRLDARQRLLWLAPSDSVVVLRAYRGQRLVFRHTFEAVEPPLPAVKCFLGAKESTSRGPVEEYYHAITFRAVADADFATFMPEDARYRVARFSIMPARKGKNESPLIINGPQGDLASLRFKGEEGDQLQIDIQLVQRQNFRRKVFNTSLKKRIVLSGPWY